MNKGIVRLAVSLLICACAYGCENPPAPTPTAPSSAPIQKSRASAIDVKYLHDAAEAAGEIDAATKEVGKGMADSETHRSLIGSRPWRLSMYASLSRIHSNATAIKALDHESRLLDDFDKKMRASATERLKFADLVSQWLKSKDDSILLLTVDPLTKSDALAEEASKELSAVRDTVAAGG
jgi:hypothetical protein